MKLLFFSRMLKMCASPHWVIVVAPFVNSYALPTMSFVKKKTSLADRRLLQLGTSFLSLTESNLQLRPPPKSDHQSKTPKFSQSNHYSWNLSCPNFLKAITWCRIWSLQRNVPWILYATQSIQRTFSFNTETAHIVIYSFLKYICSDVFLEEIPCAWFILLDD